MSKSNTKLQSITLADFERFVEASVLPALRPIALRFWELVAREAPELVPGMRGGTEKYIPIPVWRLDRDRIALSPSVKALTVSFVDGAQFDDPDRLLGGAGKTSRTLKLRSLSDLEGTSIARLVRQAAQQGPRTVYGSRSMK